MSRRAFPSLLLTLGVFVSCSSRSEEAPLATPVTDASVASDTSNAPEASARDQDRGDGGDGGFVDPAKNPSVVCAEHCLVMQTMCVDRWKQFASTDACLRACVDYPLNDPADYLTNTLWCRSHHARSAELVPQHCGHAGAFAGGGCGPTCEGFCQVAFGVWCSSAPARSFASVAECRAVCETFRYAPPVNEAGDWPYSAEGPTEGDSIECRMHELVMALRSVADRDFYCPRAGKDSPACK